MTTEPNGYLFKILLYLDVFVGSIFARDPDVTISSYCGLALRDANGNRLLRLLGRGLNAISAGHCEDAIRTDISRAQEAIARLSASSASNPGSGT